MQLTTNITVDAPAEHGWSIIAEQFGDAAEWSSSLTSSQLDTDHVEVGATRIARVGKREIRERVTGIDRDQRIFEYELVDPPGFVTSATNRWSITPSGTNKCSIDSTLDMALHPRARLLEPLLKFGLNRQIASAVEEFRSFAETGTPHERKLKNQRKAS